MTDSIQSRSADVIRDAPRVTLSCGVNPLKESTPHSFELLRSDPDGGEQTPYLWRMGRSRASS